MDSRRRSDGIPNPANAAPQPLPARQVVGFHVEGAQPSPVENNFLANEHKPAGAGSPTPVIIPPTLQATVPRDSTGARSTSTDAAAGKAVAEIIPPGTAAAPGTIAMSAPPATVAPPPPPSAAAAAVAQPTPGLLPTRTSTSAQDLAGMASGQAAAATSQPKPILQPERSEAAHAGLQRPESKESVSASTSITSQSTAFFPRSEVGDGRTGTSVPSTGGAPPHRLSKAGAEAAAQAGKHHQHHHHTHQHGHQQAGKGSAGGAPPGQPAAPTGGASTAGDKPKSQKEMTKAERRALQEAQRAAKAQAQQGGKGAPAAPVKKESNSGAAPAAAKDGAKLDSRASVAASVKGQPAGVDRAARLTEGGADGSIHGSTAAVVKVKKEKGAKVVSLNSTELFAHLQQFRKVTVQTLLSARDVHSLHPAVLQLGMLYADGTVTGASARCMAMLRTFCQVIQDYTTPEGKSLSRDLTQHLNGIINFLVECRPLAVSMGNAIKFLKLRISQVDPAMPESEAKQHLIDEIKDYIRNRIEQADKWLTQLAVQKVENGDVLMTFAYSQIVANVLLSARQQGKRFRVVVVDSRPEYEGKLMLQKLQAVGVACTYAHFNALSFVIRDVTKVFLGASAVMSNGTVMGRAGNAAVAMMAHAHSKPVILCCESFKFHERVQLDAITHNELGDPDALTEVAGRPDVKALQDWRATPRLGLLNLKYDAMPAEYVTAIVTEHAMIPPTSVPVIIREYQQYAVEHAGGL